MATNTAGNFGQFYPNRQVMYLAKRVSFADWVGTDNTAQVVGYLPPRACVFYGAVLVITGFDDSTADDLQVGVAGSDADLFASAVDVNTGDGVLTTFNDLANANRYSASARTVTVNYQTAPTDDGAAGEAIVYLEYFVAPSVS